MSCCPSVKCRNTGSGYVKECSTEKSSELDARMKELMAARQEQDVKIWSMPSADNTVVVTKKPDAASSNHIKTH